MTNQDYDTVSKREGVFLTFYDFIRIQNPGEKRNDFLFWILALDS